MQNPVPKYDVHCVMLCILLMLLCCMCKTLTHSGMSSLTGKGAPGGNKTLSNSVLGSLPHMVNLPAVILAKEKWKENDWNVFSDIYKELLPNTEEIVKVFFRH